MITATHLPCQGMMSMVFRTNGLVLFGQRNPFSVAVGRALLGLGGIVTDASWRCDTTLKFLDCF